MDDTLKGSIPFAYITLRQDVSNTSAVFADIVKLVRQQIGPVAAFRHIVAVPGLPKTRSGKIPRNSLQAIINKKEYKISPTIEDASVYSHIEEIVKDFHKNNLL